MVRVVGCAERGMDGIGSDLYLAMLRCTWDWAGPGLFFDYWL